MPLAQACDSLPEASLRCLLAVDAEGSLATVARDAAVRPMALLIGPEGGLADNERKFALANGFVACRMGPRVMRTETAGLAALTVLQAIAGDFAA
jgi:16S rRNA (uracil1498-N3)-methyltransferase